MVILLAVSSGSGAQYVLEANGPGETYELINSLLAPGYDVVESPECVHPEFGRHIAEVWDASLNQYVFEFYIHVTPDNDRCIKFDRQRMEIKTYDKSPENLIGRPGETVVYKWKFRLPDGFKPSTYFTHIHQIKAVGGNDDDPVFTLTPRKGSVNKMELIYNNQTKVAIVNLSLFEGVWMEATEKVKIDSQHGSYSISIKKVSDGSTVLSYANSDLMTIRPDNSFIRPKWGIYRSLNKPSDLRDEAVRFAGFSIAEDVSTAINDTRHNELTSLSVYPNPASERVMINYTLTENAYTQLIVFNITGAHVMTIINNEYHSAGSYSREQNLSSMSQGLYVMKLISRKSSETALFNIIQ